MAEIKNIFTEGPIPPMFIAESIQKHAEQKTIGAHSIFLGQVREDIIDGKKIKAISYTAYSEMALEQMHVIREELFDRYELNCLHVHHSLGTVEAGQICLFVFASSRHRKSAIEACEEVVEKIKNTLPVWGKEIFMDSTHQWKTNK